MCIKDTYKEFTKLSEYTSSAGLLFLRLMLAYTFFAPAMLKWSDIGSVVQWFEYMGIPFPTLNAYMAAGTEMVGVVLLTLGLLTRFISIPLIILMLFVLVGNGAGKFSVDRLIFGEKN